MMVTPGTNFNYNDYKSLLHVFETAVNNHHDKLFIRYEIPNSENEFKTLTYGQVNKIVTQLASHWRTMIDQSGVDPQQQKQSTVTIISEKSIRSIITLLAVIKLEMPFFSLSTSETEVVTAHFIKGTNTAYVIASEKHHEKIQKCIDAIHESSPSVSNNIQIWNELDIDEYLINTTVASDNNNLPMDRPFICGNPNNDKNVSSPSTQRQREKYELGPKDTAFYMHTSGSTALPKIIPRDARSILYAIKETLIKSIQQADCPDVIMKSEDVVILPSATIPGPSQITLLMGSSVVVLDQCNVKSSDLLFIAEKYKATLMLSSPITLEHLAEHLKKQDENKSSTFDKSTYQQEETMLQTLQRVKFCFSYGAPLRRSVGNFLRSKGLNVQNLYGSSETSILAISNVSKDNSEYWYSICPTNGFFHYATFEPFENQDNIYQLVLNENFPSLAPGLSNRPDGKYATKDLFFKEPEKQQNTWTYVGRVDDSINLSNGEKVFPTPMEKEICNEDIVKNCIIIGDSRETVSVLVELHLDKSIEYSPAEMTSKVYRAVHQANKDIISCTGIIVPDMVYILPSNKQLPTTRKKAVMRKKAIDMFHHEIEQLYSDYVSSS